MDAEVHKIRNGFIGVVVFSRDCFFSVWKAADRNIFESIRAKIYLLYDATNLLLSRMDSLVAVPSQRGARKNLANTTERPQLIMETSPQLRGEGR